MLIAPENLIRLPSSRRSRWGRGRCSAWWPPGQKSAELRLKRLLDPRAVEIVQAKRQEQVQARVAAAAGKLGKSLRPSNEQELGKIRIKLLNAGFRQEQAVAVFFGVKLIMLLIAIDGVVSARGDLLRDVSEGLHGGGVCRRIGVLPARLPGRPAEEVTRRVNLHGACPMPST